MICKEEYYPTQSLVFTYNQLTMSQPASYPIPGYWAVILVWKGARVGLPRLISDRLLLRLTPRILYLRNIKIGQ
jgi:hypothetical protein